MNEKKENTNTINFKEINNSFEVNKREQIFVNNIEAKLKEETNKTFEKMEILLNFFQSKTQKNNFQNEKLNEIKSLKEENDSLLNNINSLKAEQNQILDKYSRLKAKFNNSQQKNQNTNENSKK